MRVLELDSHGLPPRLRGAEDMASRLRADRDAPPVVKNWTVKFISRHPEVKSAFSRKYDYQRALAKILRY